MTRKHAPCSAAAALTGEHAAYVAKALATEGGHLAIGHGGATLYFDHGWLSGCIPDQIKAECAAAGLPVIESRMVPFDVVWRLAVPGPMVAVGRPASAPPYGPLSYAPLAVVAEAYRLAGAEVLNIPAPDAATKGELRGLRRAS